MLFLADWIVFIGFWYFVIRLYRLDGKKLPSIFVVIWFIAYFGFPQLGIVGPFCFISVEALLTLALMLTDLYRSNSGKRKPQVDPIKDALENSRL